MPAGGRRADRAAEGRGDRLDRQAAGAEQHRRAVLEAEDGRFEPERAGAAVEHRGDAAAEAVEHVRAAWSG